MDTSCTIYKTMDLIGKRWFLLILLEIHKGEGSKRYSEVRKSMPGITAKVLSQRLKELCRLGMVEKKVFSETFPVTCEYSLTSKGKDLIRIVKSIKLWALKWNIQNQVCAGTNCKDCVL